MGTTKAINTFIDEIGINLNSKYLTIATFIDLSKAFDNLDHGISIEILKRINFQGLAIKWIESYLTNRYQKTIVNGIRSNRMPIDTGVPQSSILGPLLFLIHLNGLTLIRRSSKIVMYPDGTVIYTKLHRKYDTTQQNQLQKYQTDLDLVSKWCYNHKLSINITKTKIML